MDVQKKAQMVIEEVKKAIVGKDNVLKLVLATILADGHILIEDLPGLAKTLMAKSFAKALGLEFKRVQFTQISYLVISWELTSLIRKLSSLNLKKAPCSLTYF